MTKIPIAKSVMDYFPLPTPRPMQVKVLTAVENAFQNGAKFVILEAPVGSGKSAKAITMALRYGKSHILTPKKSLQDQYFDDFSKYIHLMKGRSAYPCVYYDSSSYRDIVKSISDGGTPSPNITGLSVSQGPCNPANFNVYKRCNDRHECPYSVAVNYAMGNDHVVHNVHSFVFQAFMHNKFDKREILIVDECHNLEGIIRDFMVREIEVRGLGLTIPEHQEIGDYEDFLMDSARMPRNTEEKETYKNQVTGLMLSRMKDFVVTYTEDLLFKKTTIKFTPKRVGTMPNTLLFNFGEKILLMSGTIYDKGSFCRSLGIRDSEAVFIRVPSSFPVKNRPIVMKKEYMTDNSHKMWETNFPSMIANIQKVMSRFPDVKGLIHAPSYMAMEQIAQALKNERIITHGKDNFKCSLEQFYDAKGPKVFISPICQEGVDFKDDRARFQMILRVPYPNAGDKLTRTLMEEDYPWYNRQAMIAFGQQVGRVNRSETDHGVTVLMDSRFVQFIHRNKKFLPSWLLEAVISS